MNINDIAERAYTHAKEAGFIGDRNIDSMLMDIVDEVSEARHAFRNSKLPDWEGLKTFIKEDFELGFESRIKDTFGDEMIDILLVTLAIMKHHNIDIERHLLKMKYNELRDDHK